MDFGKPLRHTTEGLWSLRVGDWRIVYKIVKNEGLVEKCAGDSHADGRGIPFGETQQRGWQDPHIFQQGHEVWTLKIGHRREVYKLL